MAKVTRAELAEVIAEKTLSEQDPKKLTESVAAYLAAESYQVDIDSLMRDVMQYRLNKGYIEAVAVSAHELSPEVIADIKALLKDEFPEAKAIKVDTRVDKNLVGGVRVDLPTETLDLSIRNKLNLFKRLVAEEGN